LWRLRDVLADEFIQSFDAPPGHITLDLDAFDDPAHGGQQLIMFHGYYGEYQYLPIVINLCENDMVLLVGLRHGTCAATLGVDNEPALIWWDGFGPSGPTCTSTCGLTAASACP